MLDLTGYGRLTQLTTLTDRMVNDASREAIVTAARLESTGLNEEQAGQVADGLELLAMAMATVKDEEQPPPLQ
jgi:hypothetical protein